MIFGPNWPSFWDSKSHPNRLRIGLAAQGASKKLQEAPWGCQEAPKVSPRGFQKCLRDGLQRPQRTHIITKIHHASTQWKIGLRTLVLLEKAWDYINIGRTLFGKWSFKIKRLHIIIGRTLFGNWSLKRETLCGNWSIKGERVHAKPSNKKEKDRPSACRKKFYDSFNWKQKGPCPFTSQTNGTLYATVAGCRRRQYHARFTNAS